MMFLRGHSKRGKYKYEDFSKVPYILDPKGCHLYAGYLDKDGYGLMRWGGKTRRAHRVAFEEKHGRKIKAGMQLDHAVCQNPRCFFADHLEEVTSAENSRRGKGTNLTLSKAREIRARAATGRITQRKLARIYKVHFATINAIVREKNWRDT